VGREVTQTVFKGGRTYLGASTGERSRSAKITAEILRQLMKLEQDVQPATAVDIESRFPFVDLYPWIGEEETPAMLDFLRRYFEIAGPMLAVGLGYDVSSSLAANFWHQYGLPKSEFLNSVGVPTLQNFDKSWLDSDDPEPKDNGYFILMPHYDPGYDKYGCQSDELHRVLVLTWMATVALADMIKKRLESFQHSPRGALLRGALSDFESSQEVLVITEALKVAKQVFKDRLAMDNRNNARNTPTEEVRQKIKRGADLRVAKAGFAEGKPNSPQRQQQLNRLWKLRLSDLHIRLANEPANREPWMKWANSVAEGKSYFASLIATATFDLSKEFPEMIDLEPYESLADPDVRRRVFLKMEDGARLRNGDPEVVRLHLLRRHGVSAGELDTYDYLPDLRGRTVTVPSNKICTLYWRDTEGKANVKIQLRCPPDSAGVVGCTLWFEDRGISLCRPDGSVYPASKTNDTPVTWPITHLETLNDAANIRKCWEAQMEKQWPVSVPDPISSSVTSHPPGFYLPQGDGFVKQGTKKHGNYHNPPRPGDGSWLMCQFLDECYPEGGSLFFGDAEKWPEKQAECAKAQFSAFLERPLYANSPHLAFWLAVLADSRPSGSSTILATIKFLRGDITEQKISKMNRGGTAKQFWGSYRSFGGRR
jgi:hypothetical protein